MELEWITPLQVSEKWGITERQVQAMCKGEKITGALRVSKVWLIPKDAQRPIDGRTKSAKSKRELDL
jgi:hypothetical protein